MKKIFICLFASVTHLCAVPARIPTPNNILCEQQIKNYAQNIIETLFYNSNQATEDKKAILNEATQKLLAQTDVEKEYQFSIERTQQEVYQAVLKTIERHVADRSFEEAKKETGDPKITSKAQTRVTKELRAILESTGEFGPGALKDFVGKNLESKIKLTCYQFDRPYFQNLKRFDETSCRICLQDFKPSRPWIYLRPCGHDMCTECAVEYFLKRGKTHCPACNQLVDKYNLRLALQVKA